MPANVNSMMYAGAVPWHGLGKKVDGEQTAADAIVHAGLDWEVEKRQLFFQQPGDLGDYPKQYDGQFAVVRTDNATPLGVVGQGYHLVQNRSAFSLMDGVIGEVGAHYHVAGALDEGQVIWLLVKLPGILRVQGDDTIEKYLLLVNSHDGSHSLRILETPIRVVCQNTLEQALVAGRGKSHFKARHTANMAEQIDVKKIREAMGYAAEKFDVLEQAAQRMANTPMTGKMIGWSDAPTKFFKSVIDYPAPLPEMRDGNFVDPASARMRSRLDDLLRGFEQGQGADLPGAAGTVWGAYNAVVEYADYGMSSNDQRRAKSVLFGAGRQLKAKAWELALELAK